MVELVYVDELENAYSRDFSHPSLSLSLSLSSLILLKCACVCLCTMHVEMYAGEGWRGVERGSL